MNQTWVQFITTSANEILTWQMLYPQRFPLERKTWATIAVNSPSLLKNICWASKRTHEFERTRRFSKLWNTSNRENKKEKQWEKTKMLLHKKRMKLQVGVAYCFVMPMSGLRATSPSIEAEKSARVASCVSVRSHQYWTKVNTPS